MTRALGVLIVLASFALIAVMAGTVFLHFGKISVDRHIVLSLISVLFCTFVHLMMIFYLLGIGNQMKRAIVQDDLPKKEERFIRISSFRKKVIPAASLSVLLLMLTLFSGGHSDAAQQALWLHTSLAIAAFAVNFATLWREFSTLSDCIELMWEIEEEIS
ncbi:MAG: hypothetical protein HY391_01265 [Deltaproteobacteria bacterium]|nr:hypothetical protein [Deltaproteobacteria bacterium]